jgi:hypothetical protein
LTNMGYVRASVDDISMVIYSTRRSARIIIKAFKMYQQVSGLSPNIASSIAIPLGD